MKNLRKKEIAFIEAYTDRSSRETFGNAYKSAIRAGYSPKNAYHQGSTLLKKPHITKEISQIEEEIRKQAEASLDEKVCIAWENYLNAMDRGKMTEARAWFREHGELKGHYIQKVESKNEVEIKEAQQEQIREAVQQYRLNNN